MRFMRDDKRICWLEIFLKVLAATATPLLCADCGQYFTVSTAGLCFYHPERSVYPLSKGIRHYPCCENDFYFSTLLGKDIKPNLLDNETVIGC